MLPEEVNVVHSFQDGFLAIECAFCEGGGLFPETSFSDDLETAACPVCRGKGVNFVKPDAESVITCRYCGGKGKAWDEHGYFVGDVCPVCQGVGIIILDSEKGNTSEEGFLWKLIHPTIARVAKSRFEAQLYADSVEAALKEINTVVKNIVKTATGEESDGAALMNKALSARNPIIKLNHLASESDQNIQQGYMQIFAGAMIGIRNPKAHENLTIDRTRAIHFLFLASLLMSKLDERV